MEKLKIRQGKDSKIQSCWKQQCWMQRSLTPVTCISLNSPIDLFILTVYHNSLCSMDVPSWQIPALDNGGELTKVSHLGGLLPAHLHRLDQISQVDLCQISQPKPVDMPVIHPLAELQAHQPPVSAIAMTKITHHKTKIGIPCDAAMTDQLSHQSGAFTHQLSWVFADAAFHASCNSCTVAAMCILCLQLHPSAHTVKHSGWVKPRCSLNCNQHIQS